MAYTTQLKNSLLAIRRNSQGKIYMFHFSFADVPSYKLIGYLERKGNTDIRYVPHQGLVFSKQRLFELNEYGKPIREFWAESLSEQLFASKQETGILYSTRFAPNATQEDLIIADSNSETTNFDNLVFEYNLKYKWAFNTANSKAITVWNTVTMQGACDLYIEDAPYLQTLQLQGTCEIELDNAPRLKTVLLDMGAFWLPSNDDSGVRLSASPICNLSLGTLNSCVIKARYLHGYRALRNAPTSYFDGYALEVRNSNNVKIVAEECFSSIKLKNCFNVQITCTDMASIKDLQMIGCSRVTVSSQQKIQNCALVGCVAVNLDAECAYLESLASNVTHKGIVVPSVDGKTITCLSDKPV